jgi:hypothetical protein
MIKINVCGMMRVGNHAIIRWLGGCVPGKTIHYNNVGVTCGRQFEVFREECEEQLCQIRSWENADPVKCFLPSQKNILILRDPWNWLASYIAHGDFFNKAIEQYVCHFRYALDTNNSFVPVNFNLWFSSLDYRKQLAEVLGLDHSDEFLNGVSPLGAGSSFDKLQFDGNAQQMKVLERYKGFLDNPQYLGALKKCEQFNLLKLAKKFGFDDPTAKE